MATYNGYVIRRTVANKADLYTGALQLARGQWGYASNEGVLVMRDLSGNFHEMQDVDALQDEFVSKREILLQSIKSSLESRPDNSESSTSISSVSQNGSYTSAIQSQNSFARNTVISPYGTIISLGEEDSVKTIWSGARETQVTDEFVSTDMVKLKTDYTSIGSEPIGSVYFGLDKIKYIDSVGLKNLASEQWVDSNSKNKSTGIISKSGALLAVVNATTVSLGAFEGQIVNVNGSITRVSYAGSSSITDTFVGTSFNTYFCVDSSGAVVQYSAFPTPTQMRNSIYIGFSIHAPVGTITGVTNDPCIAINEMAQVRDIFDNAFNHINQGVTVKANGANLQLDKTSGYLYGFGLGYTTNETDPSRATLSAGSAITFQYRTQNGTATGNLTSVECGFYDVGGTRTALGNNKWTNQRVYAFPSGLIRLQYGQVSYNSLASAVAGLQNEAFVKYTPFSTNGQLIGIISMKSNGTDLSDTSNTVFHPVSIFGESLTGGQGVSISTLQDVYNNSTTPEILTDTTRGALSLKRGTSADTDDVFEILNGSGTKTFSVTGAGVLSVGSLDWSKITTGKPTTLAGYGITDAIDTSSTGQTKSGALTVGGAFTANGNVTLGDTSSDVVTLNAVLKNSTMQFLSIDSDFGGLWGYSTTPSGSNYSFLMSKDGATTVLNGGTTVGIRWNNTERIVVNSTGIGFFGSTPVAKPSTSADITSVRNALISLGLIS